MLLNDLLFASLIGLLPYLLLTREVLLLLRALLLLHPLLRLLLLLLNDLLFPRLLGSLLPC